MSLSKHLFVCKCLMNSPETVINGYIDFNKHADISYKYFLFYFMKCKYIPHVNEMYFLFIHCTVITITSVTINSPPPTHSIYL